VVFPDFWFLFLIIERTERFLPCRAMELPRQVRSQNLISGARGILERCAETWLKRGLSRCIGENEGDYLCVCWSDRRAEKHATAKRGRLIIAADWRIIRATQESGVPEQPQRTKERRFRMSENVCGRPSATL